MYYWFMLVLIRLKIIQSKILQRVEAAMRNMHKFHIYL